MYLCSTCVKCPGRPAGTRFPGTDVLQTLGAVNWLPGIKHSSRRAVSVLTCWAFFPAALYFVKWHYLFQMMQILHRLWEWTLFLKIERKKTPGQGQEGGTGLDNQVNGSSLGRHCQVSQGDSLSSKTLFLGRTSQNCFINTARVCPTAPPECVQHVSALILLFPGKCFPRYVLLQKIQECEGHRGAQLTFHHLCSQFPPSRVSDSW